MDGFFCGNVGVTRTYLGELVDETNEAKAFGTLSLTFSVGLVLGPFLGGNLSNPADWAPHIFRNTIFDQCPYLLGNILYSCVSLFALLLGAVSLEETWRPGSGALASEGSILQSSSRQSSPWSTRVLQLLAASGLMYGYVAARINAFVLVASLPPSMHGLNFSPQQFGYIQACSAVSIIVVQTLLYQPLVRRFGPRRMLALGLTWTIALTLPFPLYGMAVNSGSFWRLVPCGAWQALSQLGFSPAFPSLAILVNRACTSRHRGAINGWCNSLNAFFRGVCPMLAGGLFSFGCYLEPAVSGGRYVVFYANMMLAVASICLVQYGYDAGNTRPHVSCSAVDSCELRGDTGIDG
ncbi:unnamed protein product [Prorocentrum cordatum]|uniref:Major facilitator superfamily (MFS) profile domain-containing protein n=1 Tax=Prorocentrum cordatum TaxID=2364126 RepID=A0ABN9TJ29_9DINO|nr:unnamed protein product [Polarella glacialis]